MYLQPHYAANNYYYNLHIMMTELRSVTRNNNNNNNISNSLSEFK